MNLRCSALGYAVALLALLAMNPMRGATQAALRSAASGVDSVEANADAASVYHIELSMLTSCIKFGCEHPLSEKNAILSEGGHTLPVRVERLGKSKSGNAASIPMHILIAFAPGAPRRPDAELEKSLGRLFSSGWLVSVQRADGTFTPYSDPHGLAGELETPPIAAGGAGSEMSTIQKAIDDLSGRAGLRILLVETARGKNRAGPAWVGKAASRLDFVYAVDGGKVLTFPDCEGTPGGTGFPNLAGELCNGTALKRVRSCRDGVAHELTWSKAIKHLVADRKYVYDVEFKLPESADVVGRPLTLTLRDPYSYGPDPVYVEFYTRASGSQNDAAGAVRKNPGLTLRVVGPVKVAGLNRSAEL